MGIRNYLRSIAPKLSHLFFRGSNKGPLTLNDFRLVWKGKVYYPQQIRTLAGQVHAFNPEAAPSLAPTVLQSIIEWVDTHRHEGRPSEVFLFWKGIKHVPSTDTVPDKPISLDRLGWIPAK